MNHPGIENPHIDVERALANWAEWSKVGGVKLGYPRRCVMMAGYGKTSVEDFCDAADSQSAEIVDALVHDLPLNQRGAIYNRWLGCSIYVRDRDVVLVDAYEGLRWKMMKRGVF